MADKKLTLLELNLGDGTVQIGPATLGGEPNETPEPDADDAAADEDDHDGCGCPGRKAGKLLLVVLALAFLALAIKKVLGGGEDLDELEDLAELDEDEG
jgi:hypothetical protein